MGAGESSVSKVFVSANLRLLDRDNLYLNWPINLSYDFDNPGK